MDMGFIGSALGSLLLGTVGVILYPVGELLKVLHNVVPDPLALILDEIQITGTSLSMGLEWLNWLVPFNFVIASLTIFIPAILAYFGYGIVTKLVIRVLDI